MTFIKIQNSFFREDHIIAVKKIRSFRSDSGKRISYVVRVTEEAAGDADPRHRNIWCTASEVEDFINRMSLPRTLKNHPEPEPDQEPNSESTHAREPCPIQDSFSAS